MTLHYKKALFILTLFLIFSVIALQEILQKNNDGIVEKVVYSSNKITINLEKNEVPLIIFENRLLNISKGDKITYSGKKEKYKGQEQIIISKLSLIKNV